MLDSMSIFYEGPTFFASGRIFWLIWPKSLARSWHHCQYADCVTVEMAVNVTLLQYLLKTVGKGHT
jgi:hypothetical protein